MRDLMFNGKHFFDHPPFGFILLSTMYKLFGISVFSTRALNAFLGVLSSIFLYATAVRLYKKKAIGFAAAIILNTCVWYVIRVRSGNLDAPFIFFYIFSLYSAMRTKSSIAWFVPTMISFGLLIMTKTLVGVSAIVPIVWFMFPIFFKKQSVLKVLTFLIAGLVAWGVIVLPWYFYHLHTYPGFYEFHFVRIGSRGALAKDHLGQFLRLNWQLPLFYLHMGVRKWYKVWVGSSVVIIIHILVLAQKQIKSWFSSKHSKKSFDKNCTSILHADTGLVLWNLVILYPFLTTDQTQIWHLIPVYVPLALITARITYFCLKIVKSITDRYTKHLTKTYVKISKNYFWDGIYMLFFIGIALLQIKTFYYEVFPTSHYVPNETAIAQYAKQLPNARILADLDFFPIVSFYADKEVVIYNRLETPEKTVEEAFAQAPDAIMMVKNDILDQYLKTHQDIAVIKRNDSFSLISKK